MAKTGTAKGMIEYDTIQEPNYKDECMLSCEEDSMCKGVEIYHDCGGSSNFAKEGSCQFATSANTEGCDAEAYHLDFYSPLDEIFDSSVHIGGGPKGAFERKQDSLTVLASGSDIWGNSDSFEYIYFKTSEDTTFTVKTQDFEGPQVYAKDGIMLCNTLAPKSAHFSIYAHGYSTITKQWRSSAGQVTSNQNKSSLNTYPGELKVNKVATCMSAFYRLDQFDPWTQIGETMHIAFADEFYVGIAVSSYDKEMKQR